MDEPRTCGRGLAERSVLPASLAELTSAMADVLHAHQASLDLEDPDSRAEHEAYVLLEGSFRTIAAHLKATGERMAGYRDLPMGAHDREVLASDRNIDTFAAFTKTEREAVTLLQRSLDQDERMLDEMRGARK